MPVSMGPDGHVTFGVAGAAAQDLSNVLSGDLAKAGIVASLTRFFGGVGDNVTDNAAAFAAAEASAYAHIYVPEGTFYSTRPAFLLAKHYFGPGKIRTTGDNVPGRFTWMTQLPARGSEIQVDFTGDNTAVDPEYFVLNDVRTNLSEPYFSKETTPHYRVFDNRSGASGTDGLLSVAALAGATQITMNATDRLVVGAQIGFNDGGSLVTDIRTVTGLPGAGVVQLSAPLTLAYPVGTRITRGKRTMNSLHLDTVFHRGQGDCYVHAARLVVELTAAASAGAGQTHPFFVSTGGLYGGDMVAASDHVYLTGLEIQYNDTGHDVAVIGFPQSFVRDNGTAARGQVWMGGYFQSTGAAASDALWSAGGKWKRGLDTVLVSTPNHDAVNMSVGQRITYDSTTSGVGDYNLYGDVKGDTYTTKDPVTNEWVLVVDAREVLRARPGGELRQLAKPLAYAYLTANFDVPATHTRVPYVEAYDRNANLLNGVFTCSAAGAYRIAGQVSLSPTSPADTGVEVSIARNGAAVTGIAAFANKLNVVSESYARASFNVILQCAQGATLEVFVREALATQGAILWGNETNHVTFEFLG